MADRNISGECGRRKRVVWAGTRVAAGEGCTHVVEARSALYKGQERGHSVTHIMLVWTSAVTVAVGAPRRRVR